MSAFLTLRPNNTDFCRYYDFSTLNICSVDIADIPELVLNWRVRAHRRLLSN